MGLRDTAQTCESVCVFTCRPVENGGASHPLVVKIVEACEQLHAAILEWREKSDIHPTTSPSADLLHPRASVPEHIQNSILDWMGGVNLVREWVNGCGQPGESEPMARVNLVGKWVWSSYEEKKRRASGHCRGPDHLPVSYRT